MTMTSCKIYQNSASVSAHLLPFPRHFIHRPLGVLVSTHVPHSPRFGSLEVVSSSLSQAQALPSSLAISTPTQLQYVCASVKAHQFPHNMKPPHRPNRWSFVELTKSERLPCLAGCKWLLHRCWHCDSQVVPDLLKHSKICVFCKTPPNKPPWSTQSPRWMSFRGTYQ